MLAEFQALAPGKQSVIFHSRGLTASKRSPSQGQRDHFMESAPTADFVDWCRSRDPDGIAWEYRPAKKGVPQYYPIP